MIDDDYMKPGPVRVICRDGKFAHDAPVELREKYSTPVAYQEPPPRRDLRPDYRPTAASRKSILSRVRQNHTAKREPSEWSAGHRKAQVTLERILELERQGLSAAQIAIRLGCTRYTIYGRLRAAKKATT